MVVTTREHCDALSSYLLAQPTAPTAQRSDPQPQPHNLRGPSSCAAVLDVDGSTVPSGAAWKYGFGGIVELSRGIGKPSVAAGAGRCRDEAHVSEARFEARVVWHRKVVA